MHTLGTILNVLGVILTVGGLVWALCREARIWALLRDALTRGRGVTLHVPVAMSASGALQADLIVRYPDDSRADRDALSDKLTELASRVSAVEDDAKSSAQLVSALTDKMPGVAREELRKLLDDARARTLWDLSIASLGATLVLIGTVLLVLS